MNGKDIHNAVEFVGYDLIDMAEKRRFPRPFRQTVLPIAAMIALLLGVGITLPKQNQLPEAADPENPPVIEEAAPEHAGEYIQTDHPLKVLFPLLDVSTLAIYPDDDHIDWNTFYLNESKLDDTGTDIYTVHGDQVLAVDAGNGILLIRVKGEDYQGVLAVVNDPMQLSLQASSQIGVEGETVGTIAEAHNGVLAMSASSFIDDDSGNLGGILAGYAMSEGTVYNENEHLGEGYSRLEIDGNGQFSIVASGAAVGDNVQNAMEHLPSMIVDGTINNELDTTWNGTHPRSCIGQAEDGTVLMLVIEGRMQDRSLGATLPECTNILARYGAVQAMSLAYGTSALLWYDGEYVTKCSNQDLPEGRPLPNAFVVERAAP